ncbi:hypothetical protein [Capnocytophaga canis]|uniref:Lipoprotein n=1 Tax=Capnocytophaga canis TaxID=1848903 RepID=A0A0B7IR79_9FLAO|nr:hypothetical protein [Capnocytophaga canis]CEN54411.1 exported hypothetical protein [Capnocytophaga canis]
MKNNFFLFLISLLALVSCNKNDTLKEETNPQKVKYEVFLSDYTKETLFINYLDKDRVNSDYHLKKGSFIHEFETEGNFTASIRTHLRDLNDNVVTEPTSMITMRIYLNDKKVAEKVTNQPFEELDYFISVK